MRNFTLISFFSAIAFLTFAQNEFNPIFDAELSVEHLDCDFRFKSELTKTLQKKFKNDINFGQQSNYIIDIVYQDSDVNFLEGLENYYYAQSDVLVTIKSSYSNAVKEFNLAGEGKGQSECKAQATSIKKAFSGKNKTKFYEEIQQYFSDIQKNNCDALVSYVQQLRNDGQLRKPLYLVQNGIESSPCADRLSVLRKSLRNDIAEKACNEQINELTMIVNTNDVNLIRRNLYKLIQIPYDAPCNKEALELSEKIGELFKSADRSYPMDFKRFIEIQESLDENMWLKYYLLQK